METVRYLPESHRQALAYLKSICDTCTINKSGTYDFGFHEIGSLIVAPYTATIYDMLDEEFHILLIESDLDSPFPGKGQYMLDQVLFIADVHNIKLTLTAMRIDPRTQVRRLMRWYRKHGFQSEEGFRGTGMIRLPLNRYGLW